MKMILKYSQINIYILSFVCFIPEMDYVNLGCCALAFILYINTLNAGFVYDDR